MAIKKSELYSSLWASCDSLRGGMDSSQYKDYILTLLFVKYVSDKYQGGGPYAEILVPEGASFDDMLELIGNKDIGEEMDKIIARIAATNQSLIGVIDNAHFNDPVKMGKGKEMVDKLSELLAIFRDRMPNFNNHRADGDDIIGDAYEYLMRNFATESGKSKGQFYTPAEVSRILAQIIGIEHAKNNETTLYDPACGSGSLLIRAAEAAADDVKVTIYGQEKDITTAGLAKMNLVLHNKAAASITGGASTIASPKYKEEKNSSALKRFDFIVANPPFSDKNWQHGLNDTFNRFMAYGAEPPEKNGDYAWMLHIIASLKKTGKAAVILPHGVLFRGNAEAQIRQALIDSGLIKAIIGLPANLFYGTGIPACVILIDKENTSEREGIFMIDASKGYIKDGNKNRLRERDVYKITSIFKAQEELPKYSRLVPYEEIKEKNEYNLNLSRYIDSSDAEDIQSIEAHLRGGIPNDDIESLAPYWEAFPQLRGKLFSPDRDGFSALALKKEDIRQCIDTDEDFNTYGDKITAAYERWKQKADARLYHINAQTAPKALIKELAEDMMQEFAELVLIDTYDVYEVLLSYWNSQMADDVWMIVEDDYTAAREIDIFYAKPQKKAKEPDKEKPKKESGWEGRMLPKSIVTEHFFREEQLAVAQVEPVISALQGELDEQLENLEEDSIIREVLKDDSDKVDKAKLKRRLKDKTLSSEEKATLRDLLENIESLAAKTKMCKQLAESLDKYVREKYAMLSEKQCKELLIEKKWHLAIKNGIFALFMSVKLIISARNSALAERYEHTLPEIENNVKELESKVKSHLERMGFVW